MANNVKITYGNRLIKALEDVGTATLYTRDKILTDDIVVDYSDTSGVRFIDYDGTILHTYTAEEFNELSALPENPTHAGLTSQGWNWSLSDAKSYVANYGGLIIGQMYITDDGKTRLYVTLEEGRLHPYVGFGINGTATIDWGDGSATSTVTGTNVNTLVYGDHEYANAGDYVVTIDGSINILGNSYNSKIFCKNDTNTQYIDYVYLNCIQKIELGNIYGVLSTRAFHGCYSLTSVTIPDTVTSTGDNTFLDCYSLTSVTIPDTVTGISQNEFYNCHSLTSITIPNTVTSIGNSAFYSCYTLQSINIPNTVTSIGNGEFYNCYSLTSITIPDTVTSISGAFSSCYSLTSITIPNTVTSIGIVTDVNE